MKKIISLVFLFIFCVGYNYAQGDTETGSNGLPLYQEGKIYLKIKDNSSRDLSNYSASGTSNSLSDALTRTFDKYNVTKVSKPFSGLRSAQLEKTYRIEFADAANVENFIAELMAISDVDYAEKVPAMYGQAISNDPSQPYHLNLVNANAASNIHISAGAARVAVVDDAVLTTHEDLAANISATLNVSIR